MGVFERSDISLGLVEDEIDVLLALQTLVVEAHLVGRHDLRAQLGHDHAVDRYHACGDEVVGLAARAYARLCDEAVETHLARLGIGVVLGICTGLVVVATRSVAFATLESGLLRRETASRATLSVWFAVALVLRSVSLTALESVALRTAVLRLAVVVLGARCVGLRCRAEVAATVVLTIFVVSSV